MRIFSSHLSLHFSNWRRSEGPDSVSAFDTWVDQKTLVTGILVGIYEEDTNTLNVSNAGQVVLESICTHHRVHFPKGPTVFCGLVDAMTAVERATYVLESVPEGTLVLLLCANQEIYDAAYGVLHVDDHAGHCTH